MFVTADRFSGILILVLTLIKQSNTNYPKLTMKTAVASIQEKANKLGPPERARAETGGADQWVLKRRKCSGFARVNQVTSASLGYPLSVFNKNSTLPPLVVVL